MAPEAAPPGAAAAEDGRLVDYRVTLDRAGTRTPAHPTHPDISLLSPDFYVDPEPLYAWMRANAGKYGFIENVPREPWHWAYKPKSA